MNPSQLFDLDSFSQLIEAHERMTEACEEYLSIRSPNNFRQYDAFREAELHFNKTADLFCAQLLNEKTISEIIDDHNRTISHPSKARGHKQSVRSLSA